MSEEEQVILVGWDSVARACGISVQVAKRWAKRYGMPYVRLCGKITIPRDTLIAWVEQLCREVGESGGGTDRYVEQLMKNLKRRK
jgi:hypothetical protein